MSIKVGESNLKLCNSIDRSLCYKTRVVALANKFPGFIFFSEFFPMVGFKADAVISKPQMNFLLQDIQKRSGISSPDTHNMTLDNKLEQNNKVPVSAIFLDLDDNTTQKQTLALKSMLQSQIDMKTFLVINLK